MPVIAVCPVHGAFETRGIVVTNSANVILSGNIVQCAVPGCRVPARVMDGVFHFDADGVASVISAPSWSRDALRSVQKELSIAGRALRDEQSYSDARAYKMLEGRLGEIDARFGELGRDLTREIRAVRQKEPRRKLWQFIGGVAVAIGFVVDVYTMGAITKEVVAPVIEWAVSEYQQGHEPRPEDFPLPPPGGAPPAAR